MYVSVSAQLMYQVIKAWPTTLYSPQVMINAVEVLAVHTYSVQCDIISEL